LKEGALSKRFNDLDSRSIYCQGEGGSFRYGGEVSVFGFVPATATAPAIASTAATTPSEKTCFICPS
jgi:hypothetical protein